MGPTAWETNKHTQTKPNETLRLVTIHWGLKTRNDQSVQETEQYLSRFFTARSNCPEHVDLNVSSRAAGFHLVLSERVYLSLKDSVPIDCHYMTDRLQRFELNIFICALLKKQRPCPKWNTSCALQSYELTMAAACVCLLSSRDRRVSHSSFNPLTVTPPFWKTWKCSI